MTTKTVKWTVSQFLMQPRGGNTYEINTFEDGIEAPCEVQICAMDGVASLCQINYTPQGWDQTNFYVSVDSTTLSINAAPSYVSMSAVYHQWYHDGTGGWTGQAGGPMGIPADESKIHTVHQGLGALVLNPDRQGDVDPVPLNMVSISIGDSISGSMDVTAHSRQNFNPGRGWYPCYCWQQHYYPTECQEAYASITYTTVGAIGDSPPDGTYYRRSLVDNRYLNPMQSLVRPKYDTFMVQERRGYTGNAAYVNTFNGGWYRQSYVGVGWRGYIYNSNLQSPAWKSHPVNASWEDRVLSPSRVSQQDVFDECTYDDSWLQGKYWAYDEPYDPVLYPLGVEKPSDIGFHMAGGEYLNYVASENDLKVQSRKYSRGSARYKTGSRIQDWMSKSLSWTFCSGKLYSSFSGGQSHEHIGSGNYHLKKVTYTGYENLTYLPYVWRSKQQPGGGHYYYMMSQGGDDISSGLYITYFTPNHAEADTPFNEANFPKIATALASVCLHTGQYTSIYDQGRNNCEAPGGIRPITDRIYDVEFEVEGLNYRRRIVQPGDVGPVPYGEYDKCTDPATGESSSGVPNYWSSYSQPAIQTIPNVWNKTLQFPVDARWFAEFRNEHHSEDSDNPDGTYSWNSTANGAKLVLDTCHTRAEDVANYVGRITHLYPSDTLYNGVDIGPIGAFSGVSGYVSADSPRPAGSIIGDQLVTAFSVTPPDINDHVWIRKYNS